MEALRPDDPKTLGGYRLLACLGEGGMGRVFLASGASREYVAIKVIARSALDGGAELEDPQAEYESRFAREIAIMRSIDAPSTALYVDADPDGDPLWLATQYVSGPTLQQLAQPLSVASAAILGAHLASGLAALHKSGLAHRDLKPGNVILGDEGPKLIDFGLSVLVGRVDDPRGHLTSLGMAPGTKDWMAPEQRAGQGQAASDIYSLGMLLGYTLTTKRAHTPSPRLKELDAPLADVIAEMMDPSVLRRPTASELAQRLTAIATRHGASATQALSQLVADTYGAHTPPKIPDSPPAPLGETQHDDTTRSLAQTPAPDPRNWDEAQRAAANIRSVYARSKELLPT